ncbi:unnamed protein product [Lupinus luteus]|uniref:MBD domain-containing protein n=1 Tax=Lupinus luteus TaxID=3873 RepID=A0AAV1W0K5_LUPLU
MDQGLTREESDSMAEKDFINPSFVHEPMTTSRVQLHHVYLEKKLLDRISESMEDQISEIIEQIKAPEKPQNDGEQVDQVDQVDQPSPPVMRATDVGDSTVNKVSLIIEDGDKSASNNNPTFSVKERLQDWKIEQKQRKLGSSKYYIYHHSRSGKMFRSKVEVVRFVLTETCPPKPSTRRKKSRKGKKRYNKRNKTPKKTSKDERTTVGEVISQNIVEGVVSNQLNDAATVNQDPILGFNASTIETKVYSNHEELQIYDLMSPEEILNEYSIAFHRGEL